MKNGNRIEARTFAAQGWTFGMLNGTAGYVKLFPLGSIVIVPKLRKGWVAYSPRRSRVRAGVLVAIGAHKGKGLKGYLISLDAICRVPDSWVWQDGGTGTLNSPIGARKVRPLHWKSGAGCKPHPTRFFTSALRGERSE